MVTCYEKADGLRQRAFRTILTAFSRPGQIRRLPVSGRDSDALFMILETLLDQEATHCIIHGDKGSLLSQRLFASTGSRQVASEEADFIIAPDGHTGGTIERAKLGSLEYPERSATVVYCVTALHSEKPVPLRCSLTGPGIADRCALPAMDGFEYGELLQWSRINQQFPLGIDAIFVDSEGRLMALPRSTQCHMEDEWWPMQP